MLLTKQFGFSLIAIMATFTFAPAPAFVDSRDISPIGFVPRSVLSSTPSPMPTSIPSHDTTHHIVGVAHFVVNDKTIRSSIKPSWWGCNCVVVRNVQVTNTYTYFNFGPTVVANPSSYPQNLQLSFTATVSGSYNANFNVSAIVVSGGAGWNVTASTSAGVSDTIQIPANAPTVHLAAEFETQDYSFQIWQNPWIGNDYQLGSGTIFRPTGYIYFYTWNS